MAGGQGRGWARPTWTWQKSTSQRHLWAPADTDWTRWVGSRCFYGAHGTAKTSTLLGHIKDVGRFGVNYLSVGQQDLAVSLASSAEDCTGLEWSELEGVPVLRDCSVVLSVRADSIHDAGDHELISGEIMGVSIGDRELRPLVYRTHFLHPDSYLSIGFDVGGPRRDPAVVQVGVDERLGGGDPVDRAELIHNVLELCRGAAGDLA